MVQPSPSHLSPTPLPSVAVVMPMHNRAHCVVAALSSVVAQTHRPAQIIVVDNASTDNSWEVVETWMRQQQQALSADESGQDAHENSREAEQNRRATEINIRESKEKSRDTRENLQIEDEHRATSFLLLSEPRAGASAARNRGLASVTAEWVSFFDSDDIMSPDFLERMLQTAQAQQRAWVCTRSCMVFADGRTRTRWSKPQPSVAEHLLGACITTQTFLARTTLLRSIKGWNEALLVWNDYELGLRLLLASPQPAWCEGVFHQLSQHAESITGRGYAYRSQAIIQTLESMAKTLQRRGTTHGCSQHRFDWFALQCRMAIVEGQLLREHSPKAAQKLSDTVLPLCPKPSWLLQGFCWCLRHYVRCGGRGAWRIALSVLHFLNG